MNRLNPTLLYRCAAVLFLLFAIGHTVGFLMFTPDSAEGQDVYARMVTVKFRIGDSHFSYGNFYLGFGLFVTMYKLFSAYLAYALARMTRDALPMPVGLPWVFAGMQVISLALSVAYFAAPPIILSSLLVLILGAAAIGTSKARKPRIVTG